MRIPPTSMAFTLLLGFLVALPSFGIDMSLPALTATGATLHVAPARVGLTMSLFVVGFAIAPLLYGPVSDRYGRKPVILFACLVFTVASVGCAVARSLVALLAWRIVQGAGAGASMTIAFAIVRDLFDGHAARTKISYITMATMVVPMIAPTAGVALLARGGWRTIHVVLAGVGTLLLLAMLFGFSESASLGPTRRLAAPVIARNYIRVLTHPSCLGYLLVSAAAFGSLFAYVSGSSLFLINVVGLSLQQYGLVFGATSLGIMGGSFLSSRLNTLKVAPSYLLICGLALATVTTMLLLLMTLAGWMPLPVVIPQLVLGNLAFGLIMPNAIERAMQPLPQIAGAAGAAMGCIQMAMGAAASGLVATLYDGHTALSMTALMALCSLLALAAYLLVARPAECAVPITARGKHAHTETRGVVFVDPSHRHLAHIARCEPINTTKINAPIITRRLVADAKDGITELMNGFVAEWEGLVALAKDEGLQEAGRSRMAVELRRMCGEFLLSSLADRGFLPRHGFPTDVVSFLPGKEFRSPQDAAQDGTRQFRTIGPQRSLDLAIRDYAPGSEIVLDGLVHKSAGVTLNWKRPASEENVAEVQSLRHLWRCAACGASDT